MKRIGNLYENIYDMDNIEKAYKKRYAKTQEMKEKFLI